jgi:hypothetical protein
MCPGRRSRARTRHGSGRAAGLYLHYNHFPFGMLWYYGKSTYNVGSVGTADGNRLSWMSQGYEHKGHQRGTGFRCAWADGC